MANLPLAFAELLGGGVLLVSGISGSSVADTLEGKVTMHPFVTGTGPSSGSPSSSSPTTAGGYRNPCPGATQERTDQGQDWGNVHTIVAIGAGTITNIYPGLSGFGETVIEKLSTNPVPQYGPYIYYGFETSGCHAAVRQGQRVSAGTTIGAGGAGGGVEIGFWNPSTGRAMGAPDFTGNNATPAGVAFRRLVTGH